MTVSQYGGACTAGTSGSSFIEYVGTLLSPEGAELRPQATRRSEQSGRVKAYLRPASRSPNGAFSGVRGGYIELGRPYLENCTVDASIFILCFVAKLIRAHGGCLGTRSR